MRYTLIVILILIGTSSISQVTFISIPLDKQLIGRDPITNLGNIAIDGEVDNSNISYDSILIEVFRNNILHQKTSQFLSYSSHIASFNFNISIVAELVNYSLKIYGKSGSIATLQKQVDSIVAGDAYIIQGQSNAEARMLSGSANSNQNEFIRVYANGTHFKDTLLNNDNWYIGEGDGNRNTNGNTGQWGLKLARMLIDSLNIPIAIFNSGHGGKDIAFFQAPSDYQTSQESNYGRQYYRLNKTGLKDFVRAVFWSQGTWDGENYSNTSTLEYKNYFLSLKSDWLRDYPSLEKYYIFQTKNGCGGFLHKIKEAQRQLAFENQDISIMSTAALIHYEDDCHFPFINGYESFAKRIFPLVLRNFYGITTSNEIDPPMIVSANLINDTTLIVETDADELSIQTIAEDFELTNVESSTITNIEASSNKIIFTLSNNPGNGATISYLAQDTTLGNFITNQLGLELLCFYQYPIVDNSGGADSVLKDVIKVYPNPTDGLLHIELQVNISIATITLIDFSGREVLARRFNTNKVEISLPETNGIYLLIVESENGSIYMKRIVKQ